MRIATYCRVSAKLGKKPRGNEQSIESQRIKLLEFAKAMNWTIVAESEDRESGELGTVRYR